MSGKGSSEVERGVSGTQQGPVQSVGDALSVEDAFGQMIESYGHWQLWATFTWRPRRYQKWKRSKARRYDENGRGVPLEYQTGESRIGFVKQDTCRRHIEKWFDDKFGPEADYVYAIENGNSGHHNHVHAVVGCLPDPDVCRRDLWSEWLDKRGRNRIEPYDMSLGAGHYLGKYISKAIHDWDLRIGGVGGALIEAGPSRLHGQRSPGQVEMRPDLRTVTIRKAYREATRSGTFNGSYSDFKKLAGSAIGRG